MSTQTVTIDTDEWKYPDVTGVEHVVTNAETFTFTLTDVSTTGAQYVLDGGSVKCNDGSRIYIRKGSDIHVLYPKDATSEGAADRQFVSGEWIMNDPYTGLEQWWKPTSFNVDDVDDPGTITATFEDQYGNTFTWTAVSVA
jgi:hypothetical protein